MPSFSRLPFSAIIMLPMVQGKDSSDWIPQQIIQPMPREHAWKLRGDLADDNFKPKLHLDALLQDIAVTAQSPIQLTHRSFVPKDALYLSFRSKKGWGIKHCLRLTLTYPNEEFGNEDFGAWDPENDQKSTIKNTISISKEELKGSIFLQIALKEDAWDFPECTGISLIPSSSAFTATFPFVKMKQKLRIGNLETIQEELELTTVKPLMYLVGWETVNEGARELLKPTLKTEILKKSWPLDSKKQYLLHSKDSTHTLVQMRIAISVPYQKDHEVQNWIAQCLSFDGLAREDSIVEVEIRNEHVYFMVTLVPVGIEASGVILRFKENSREICAQEGWSIVAEHTTKIYS